MGAGCLCCDRLTDLKPLRLSCLQTNNKPFVDLPLSIFWGDVRWLWRCYVLTTPVWVCKSETRERSTRLNKCGWPISMAPIFNAAPQTLWPRVISRSVATPFLKSRSPCQDLLDYGVTVKATGWLGSRTHGQSQPAQQTSLPCSRVHSVHEWASVSPKHVDKVYRKSLSHCREQSQLHVKSAHSLALDRLPLCFCLVFNWGKVHKKRTCTLLYNKHNKWSVWL